ncbi:MAG: hypothetical protein IKR34_02745 [Candidatus Gastranaerophilales bacterium]|nr:hypothetical protein [Candidatus Gastranaerophilales bacterium]
MTEISKKKIPFCPLLSAGAPDSRICLQENCAWWIASTKTCSVYVIAHNNVLDIKSKQGK